MCRGLATRPGRDHHQRLGQPYHTVLGSFHPNPSPYWRCC
ncbi:hypothetical protein KSS87_003418 [Heliosperma pusillum]|nr:hypothetical protein KSS87_003418 [Heliosperma pusillum]